MSADPATDTRRWSRTARDCAPPSPPLWPWLVLAAVALMALLSAAAHGATCPSWGACWEADARCEATKRRAWKPCRVKVRKCFERAVRCSGERTA